MPSSTRGISDGDAPGVSILSLKGGSLACPSSLSSSTTLPLDGTAPGFVARAAERNFPELDDARVVGVDDDDDTGVDDDDGNNVIDVLAAFGSSATGTKDDPRSGNEDDDDEKVLLLL
jgi:hypothetical protein